MLEQELNRKLQRLQDDLQMIVTLQQVTDIKKSESKPVSTGEYLISEAEAQKTDKDGCLEGNSTETKQDCEVSSESKSSKGKEKTLSSGDSKQTSDVAEGNTDTSERTNRASSVPRESSGYPERIRSRSVTHSSPGRIESRCTSRTREDVIAAQSPNDSYHDGSETGASILKSPSSDPVVSNDLKQLSQSKSSSFTHKDYDNIAMELGEEREHRVKAEKTVYKLKEILSGNRITIQEMIMSKRTALHMAKDLREDVEKLKMERVNLMRDLEDLKAENRLMRSRVDEESKKKNELFEDLVCLRKSIEAMQKTSQQTHLDHSKLLKETEKKYLTVSEEKAALQENISQLEKHIFELEITLKQTELECEDQKRKNTFTFHDPKIQNMLQKEVQKQCSNYRSLLEKQSSQYVALQKKYEITEKQYQRYKTQVDEMSAQLSDLQVKYNKMEKDKCILEQKLKQAEKIDIGKLKGSQNKIINLQAMLDVSEKVMESMVAEKDEAEEAIRDLTEIAKFHQSKTTELAAAKEELERLVKSEEQQLQEKTERAQQLMNDVEKLQKQNNELQDRVVYLENVLQKYEAWKAQQVDDKLKESKQELKEALSIKEKIIEDQVSTIQTLKENLKDKDKEINMLVKERTEQERDFGAKLANERYIREGMQNELSELQSRKNELRQKMIQIEAELSCARKTYNSNIHKKILQEMERKIESKRKEWNSQIQLLTKEKNEALQAASYNRRRLCNIQQLLLNLGKH